MKTSEAIDWMNEKISLYKRTLEIRRFEVGKSELRAADYSADEMQFCGDVSLFINLAALVGCPISVTTRPDEYLSVSFVYGGVRWFMLVNNVFEKEDQ